MLRYLTLFWALATAVCWAQIETANGGVISPWSPQLKIRTEFLDTENSQTAGLRLTYTFAASRKEDIRLILPLRYRRLEGVEAAGLGDLRVRYKRSLFQEDGVMRSDRLALLLETDLPIGRSNVEGWMPRAQLGLGSPQLGAGLVFSRIRDRHRFSAEVGWREPLNRLAGTGRVNLAYWYRLTPAQFPDDELPVEVRGVLELLSEYRGAEFGQPAGVLVWLAPGLQIHPDENIQFEVNARVPLAQSLDDQLGRRNWGGSVTVKLRF